MKNQYFTVLKLLIKNLFLPIKGQKRSDGENKRLVLFVILGICYISIAASLVSLVVVLSEVIITLNLINEFITMLLGIGAFIVLIFGIVSLLSNLYFSNDTEFFLTLPVKPSTIFLAKFTVVYATELILTLLMLTPLIVTLGIMAALPVYFYLIIMIGLLLGPAIPLIIASILAIPLMYIVSFFKQKGALTSVVIILLFGIGFGFYYYFIIDFQMNMGSGEGNLEEMLLSLVGAMKVLSNIFYPYLALTRLATLTPFGGFFPLISALLNLTIFVGSLAVLLAISMLISNAVYRRGAASQLEGRKNKSTVKRDYVSGNSLTALIKKEWRELIRTPMFAYQCLSGIVLAPIMVAMFSFSGGIAGMMTIEPDVGEIIANPEWMTMTMRWFMGFGMLIMMGIGMNLAASSAITREGKNFYISKTIPVDYKTQVKAKLILSCLISLASILTALITLTIFTGEFLYPVLGLIFGAVYSYGLNCMSIYMDLRKPKLDWSTPNQAIKQNFNIMIPFFIDMAISVVLIIVPIVIAIFFAVMPIAGTLIIWLIFFAIAITSALVFHNVLYKNVDALYEKLSV